MGDPITLGTAALSMASIGFKAAGQENAAQGQAAADTFKAQQLEEAAQYGELKATQTGAQMTRNLVMTLGNIDAVRAASRVDPSSPSAAAVHDFVEQTGEEQRSITTSNIARQAQMDEQNAQYMRYASSQALLGGDLAAAGTILGGLGGGIKSMGGFGGGGGGGGSSPFDVTGSLY